MVHTRELAGLIAASALITLDGTAVTVALPSIRADLALRYAAMQWIGDASLLALAALLVPAGVLADRLGRMRTIRLGLLGFIAASLGCAAAAAGPALILIRVAQGAAAALVLPGVVAIMREAYTDPAERTRIFGLWAAGTGLASAVGPLLGGGLVDLIHWRAVFALSAGAGATALLLLRGVQAQPAPSLARPMPVASTVALAVFVAALAYLLIEVPAAGWSPASRFAAALAVIPAVVVVGAPRRERLLPREVLTSRNCLAGNAATFALYFGVFGLSFLIVVYTQQTLGYSGTWSGVGVLPVSIAMLLLSEPFGRAASRFGVRIAVGAGSLIAAGGVLWIAAGPDPLPFWSRIMLGSSVFGLGVSLAVSALTQAAVGSVPHRCAGAAAGLNHATVRAAGLVAIALLGSLAAADSGEMSGDGLKRALFVCGTVIAIVGAVSALLVDDAAPGGLGGTDG